MNQIIKQYSHIISRYEILTWDCEPLNYRFKANITFIDGSYLAIKDYLFSEGRK